MKLTIDGKLYNYDKPITLEALKDDLGIEAYAATVNNRIRELTYVLTKDCDVVFLNLLDKDAIRIYESTLRYVILMALKNLYPNTSLKYNYSISRSILAIPKGLPGRLTPLVLSKLDQEVRRLINLSLPIKRTRIDIDDAVEYYQEMGYSDKAEVLKYREEDYVNMYICDGYKNYMFGYMLPNTSYLKDFKFIMYQPGFMIQYPRSEVGGVIPVFDDAPIFNKTIKEAAIWGDIIKGDNIARINQYVEDNRSVELVQMCETKHNRQLAELGNQISENKDAIRLICIAGPSSSGKTTFSMRLKVELLSRGFTPVMISIDDYYQPRDKAPLDEDGKPDLEHINALDIKLFNEHIKNLINGEEVTLPRFNFKTGRRESGKTVKVSESCPIIIEGIHALNDLLTPSIPAFQKYKIFIAPQTQLHIDNHNPISFTDLRLLRRMVRDQRYRNSPAEETLSMWDSVRKGEFKWIYPFQEEANYVFNSELTYEFLVLKKHAYKSLSSIPRDSSHFISANRLLKFLKYFKEIDDELVPNNSILREFIGNSVFH
ncbi:MAG: hypothetical protein WC939_04615 [Acholeplasmataceae bacterium]